MALGYGRVGTNQFACAKFIVDKNGIQNGATHSTIAAALTDASSGETIFIKPGTYTENLILKDGVNLCSFGTEYWGQVEIVGKLTCTYSGLVVMTGIKITTNSDNCVSMTGSNSCTLRLIQCGIYAADNTAILINNSNANLNIRRSKADVETTGIALFTITTGSINIIESILSNTGGSSTASTLATGLNGIRRCVVDFPISTSGTAALLFTWSEINTASTNSVCITCAGSGSHDNKYSNFASGTAQSLVFTAGTNNRVQYCNINSTNTNPIGGAGSVAYTDVAFESTGIEINTTTTTANINNIGYFRASKQPSFLAYLSGDAANKTGNNTTYTIGTDALTEVFDLNGDFNTNGTFTAPVDGKYLLQYMCTLGDISANCTLTMDLVTTARTYKRLENLNGSFGTQAYEIVAVADMSATDTATYTVNLNGIGADTADIKGAATLRTYVSGQLIA